EAVTKDLSLGRYQSKYRPLTAMPNVPYACLRLPTGGGKTILGAYSVKLAAESWLERDFPVALWLVPSNTIRTQTADALKNPRHAYRQVLDDAFEGWVRVFDIEEFPNIRPTDLRDAACVIVGTIQTLRVENTAGRKVYDHHEALEPHFSTLKNFPAGLERDERGQVKYSFANLLHLHRPLMIVDEAHNAVTGLTHTMHERLNPACIIEFTATPRPQSNVLFSVSASALKSEEMIKLPIVLTAHTSWQAAVSGALAERHRLAESAKNETPFIRPIILFQAQNKDQEVHAEALRKHLIDNENIPAEKIAIVTGDQRELDGIDLFDPKCPIEYVITVQALKEGWDCSFAYVFCSVANIRSATDVEQLLGRVLRMPYARRRSVEELNRAYAHVCEPNFIHAATNLKDRLVDMGFEAEEAEDNIEMPGLDLQGGGAAPPAPSVVTIPVPSAQAVAALPQLVRAQIGIETKLDGSAVVTVSKPLSERDENTVLTLVPPDEQEQVRKQLVFQRHQAARLDCPAARHQKFAVPVLCLRVQGDLLLAEPDLFLDLGGWKLLDNPAALTPGEFKPVEGYQSFEFDVDKDKVTYGHVSASVRQPELRGLDAAWDEKVLARWLDRQCRQPDIGQTELLEFVRRIVTDQLDPKVPLGALVFAKYRLAKAITAKIAQYRNAAKSGAYQTSLFANNAPVEVSFDYGFYFPPDHYPAKWFYRGNFRFAKHYYGADRVGELKDQGEEFDCAQALDMNPDVRFWVRNDLSGRPQTAFRLPLASGWFYPDFVALLNDGRILVVEYKGAHLINDPDTKQKDNIGAFWETHSQGKGLFLMAEKEREGFGVADQIRRKFALKIP
ncbi:MAG: DEAD/DEAH box helicase family protein, partial [Gammaproteobacteria bacterium]|nr:DEAD/DEAH box helicase family protein [Gammaproteobacteria bacterium]